MSRRMVQVARRWATCSGKFTPRAQRPLAHCSHPSLVSTQFVADCLPRFFSAWKDTFGSAQPEMVDVEKMMWRTMANGEKVTRSNSEGFDKVVAKLCSNDGRNADSMFMVFERPTAA